MSAKNHQIIQGFLDSNQYSQKNIKHYEILFGKTFVSTGGKNTTEEFVRLLNLKPNQKVLDVGCGLGGSAFFMADNYQVKVTGVDLSSNMISMAKHYNLQQDPSIRQNVTFEVADITQYECENGSFDAIYARESLIYIKDKHRLFKSFWNWLKPGGRLLFSEYSLNGKNPISQLSSEFISYLNNRRYHMGTIDQYQQWLTQARFQKINTVDKTNQCIEILREDNNRLLRDKSDILQNITRKEYDEIVDSWEIKMQRCINGEQSWVLVYAEK